ncbi:hypothetical protein D3C75_293770 [compost metagenome]
MVPWVLWLVAAGVLLVIEMFTLTFYLFWLTVGAAAALLVSLIWPEAILLQVAAGAVVTVLLTVFSKPLVARFKHARGFEDIGTEITGRQGIVVEALEPGRYGQVKVGGDTWSAVSGEVLARDELVRVVRRSSTIIEVERWEEYS